MIKINISSLIDSSQGEIEINEKVDKLSKEVNLSKFLSILGQIYKTDHGILASGYLSGQEKLKCDRCGSEFISEISQSFSQEYLMLGKTEGEEEDEEHAGFVVNDKNEIDLERVIIEEIVVKDLRKRLCDKKCRGVCEHCGKDLNKGNCSCYTKLKKKNPFYKLKDFKEKN